MSCNEGGRTFNRFYLYLNMKKILFQQSGGLGWEGSFSENPDF